ncbi:MAG TPA: energy transducer TonB [Candidatus Polarisedimenticolaceae bacterium]|nr:energy transducer TonB [Candidatus Polarisedimenticolaceae bacterium]
MHAAPYPLGSRKSDKPLLIGAAIVAVVIHLVILFGVVLPDLRAPEPPVVSEPTITLQRTVLPAPPIDRLAPRRASESHRRAPVPDRIAPPVEPLREPPADITAFAAPEIPDPDVGEPTPPFDAGPIDPRTPGLTPPRLIATTRVDPDYPEAGRVARRDAHVELHAEILASGEIGAIEIVRCDAPGLGFEQAAARAVARWRYEPAVLHGSRVATFVTVYVDFTLH